MKKVLKPISFLLVIVLSLAVFTGCDAFKAKADITEYAIKAVFDDENKTLSADMTVTYYNHTETELGEVMFHLYPNAYRQTSQFSPINDSDIDEAYPNGVSFGDIAVSKVSIGGADVAFTIGGTDENILVVPLSATLKPTKKTAIFIQFTLKVPNMRHRYGYYDKTVNLGNWYPIACIYEDGAFLQDPYYNTGDPFYADVANYEVSITAPAKYSVAASGATVKTENNADLTVATTSFKGNKMRDFAVVLGEFSIVNEMVGKTKINYYYYDDAKFEENVKVAVDAVTTFNNLFGTYPYESLAVVQTAFLMGGMEYPGLVYISDALNNAIYKDTIIHEIAHQWWACVVGNNQIKHAWMDEALAEYSTTMFYENNPSYEVDHRLRVADVLSSFLLYLEMYKHNGKDDTSMNRAINAYAGPLEYQFLVYVQGHIMMDALNTMIGDKAFKAALQDYYKSSMYQIATPDTLIGAFEKAAKRELKSYFNSWIEGKVQMFND